MGAPELEKKPSQPRKQLKYTYFLPVQVSADGTLEVPPAIAHQIKRQAMQQEAKEPAGDISPEHFTVKESNVLQEDP